MVTLFVVLFYAMLLVFVGLIGYRIYLLIQHEQKRGPLVSHYILYAAALAMLCAIIIGILNR